MTKIARWLCVLGLMLCVVPAVAAPPKCWPSPTPTDLLIGVQLAKTPPTSVAIGTVVYAASSVGLVYGWTCKAADGQHYKHIAGGPWESFPKEWAYIADTLLRGTDADRAAAWEKYATATEWDARLKPDLDMVWAMLPNAPVVPPPGSLVVAPTTICATADKDGAGKCIRRPTYAWDGSARSTVAAAEKADVGSPCNPAIGAAGFYGVLGRTDRVAPCVKN